MAGSALLLAGCAMNAAGKEGDDPLKMTCQAEAAQSAIGRTADEATVEAVRTAARARAVRVLHPGQPATMDYRPDRLNLEVDADNKIVSARCG